MSEETADYVSGLFGLSNGAAASIVERAPAPAYYAGNGNVALRRLLTPRTSVRSRLWEIIWSRQTIEHLHEGRLAANSVHEMDGRVVQMMLLR